MGIDKAFYFLEPFFSGFHPDAGDYLKQERIEDNWCPIIGWYGGTWVNVEEPRNGLGRMHNHPIRIVERFWK